MRKYLLSVDIEGITGVTGNSHANTASGKHYPIAQNYMHHDVNAVVEGILSSDPEAMIIVRDAHGSSLNLNLEKLHPKAHLVQGWGNGTEMVTPLDPGFTGIFLVGYHAGGHNPDAVLAHTMSSAIQSVHLNGICLNEAGIAGLHGSAQKVPVGFLSGDDQSTKEAREIFGEELITVAVKKSLGRDSALSLPLKEAGTLLKEKAREATTLLIKKKIKPLQFAKPFKMEIRLFSRGYQKNAFEPLANLLSVEQGYEFDHKRFIVKFQAASALEVYRKMNLVIALIYGIGAMANS